MSNTTKTRALTSNLRPGGPCGSYKVWTVTTKWTREDGRSGHHKEEFKNEAQALNWIKWA